jgi:hypothetical protein
MNNHQKMLMIMMILKNDLLARIASHIPVMQATRFALASRSLLKVVEARLEETKRGRTTINFTK